MAMISGTPRIAFTVATLSALVLGGCSGGLYGTVPAGSQTDEGGFGNPTYHNMLVHTGQIEVQAELGQKFAAAVPTTVNFAFNSAQLDGAAQSVLRKQADFMRQFPEVRFSVYGHTDEVGADAYNASLGKRRAQAVVAALGRYGVSRARLDALVSFGERQPLIANAGNERANRRTVTEVAGFVTDHPLVLDGNYAALVYRTYVAGPVGAAPVAAPVTPTTP
jgi:peptidoglycan-associated lipoprotein